MKIRSNSELDATDGACDLLSRAVRPGEVVGRAELDLDLVVGEVQRRDLPALQDELRGPAVGLLHAALHARERVVEA